MTDYSQIISWRELFKALFCCHVWKQGKLIVSRLVGYGRWEESWSCSKCKIIRWQRRNHDRRCIWKMRA